MQVTNEIEATHTITFVMDHKELDILTAALDNLMGTKPVSDVESVLLCELYNGLMEAFGDR